MDRHEEEAHGERVAKGPRLRGSKFELALPDDGEPTPRWGDRKVMRRVGDVVMIQRKDVDYVVAYDREDEERAYFYYPTKRRTAQEARAAAEAELERRAR